MRSDSTRLDCSEMQGIGIQSTYLVLRQPPYPATTGGRDLCAAGSFVVVANVFEEMWLGELAHVMHSGVLPTGIWFLASGTPYRRPDARCFGVPVSLAKLTTAVWVSRGTMDFAHDMTTADAASKAVKLLIMEKLLD